MGERCPNCAELREQLFEARTESRPSDVTLVNVRNRLIKWASDDTDNDPIAVLNDLARTVNSKADEE